MARLLSSFANRFRLSVTRSCGGDMPRFCGWRSCSPQIVKCQNGRTVGGEEEVIVVVVKFEETIPFELFNSLSGCLGDRQAEESGTREHRSISRLRYSPTRRRLRCSRRSSIALLVYYIDIVVLIYLVIWDRHENTTLDWMGCGISLCYTAVRLFDNSPDSLSLFGRGWLGSVWLGSYCAPCRVFSTELHTECGRI